MKKDEKLNNAIVQAVVELFSELGAPVSHMSTEDIISGSNHSQVTVLLSFLGKPSGYLTFKGSLAFADEVYRNVFGDDGAANDYAMLKDSMTEILNMISGKIKSNYDAGDHFSISLGTTIIHTDTMQAHSSDENKEVSSFSFKYKDHTFSTEVLLT